jgi:hypothetical protein
MRNLLIAIATASCFVCAPAAGSPDVPTEAQVIINQVHTAAKNKDTIALDKLMVREFVWSFGGDGDSKQALAEWKKNPVAFQNLQRVTGLPCTVKQAIIECPRNARANYRAGFEQTPAGWRMTYFVAGD